MSSPSEKKKYNTNTAFKDENVELENIFLKNEVQCIKNYFGGNTGCLVEGKLWKQCSGP